MAQGPSLGQAPPIVSARVARTLYLIAALAAAVVFVVDVTGIFGWTVTSNAGWAIGLLLVIPVADRLRRLKFGGVEAELDARVSQVEDRVADLGDTSDEALPKATDRGTPLSGHDGVFASLERIVWVDDNPEENRLHIAELRRRFDVITATSTGAGLREVEKQPDTTAVVSDAVRYEDGGRPNYYAGAELLAALRAKYAQIPVYVYCGPESVDRQAPALYEAGARLVTWSWQELANAIRADARATFEAHVGAILHSLYERVDSQERGIDFVVHDGDQLVGVEAKDWRRRPTERAFDAAAETLERLVREGKIVRAVLVAPRDVYGPDQIERLPDGIQAVSLQRLEEILRRPR